ITVFLQYDVSIRYRNKRRPDVNSVAVHIQLRNGDTPIFSHDDSLMAVIEDDMIMYRVKTGMLVILKNLGELHKTYRPFFVPYIPKVIHFPFVFHVCPWIPQTLMVIVVSRLDVGKDLARNRLQRMDISSAAVGLVYTRRRGFHGIPIGKKGLLLGITQHQFI